MNAPGYRNLIIHSALVFLLSFLLGTLMHEGAHAVVAKLAGLKTVLHHNYVSTGGEELASPLMAIMVPAAGPLMSLVQGIIFLMLVRRKSPRNLLTLFYLWMSVLGFINVGGYLMMTPLISYGDTGRVFALLGAPGWVMWSVALAGLLGLMKVMLGFVQDFENQLPKEFKGRDFGPGQLANAVIALPVLIGCVLTTLVSLPVPTFLSILYPATSPFITFMIYGQLRRKRDLLQGTAHYPEKLSLTLLVVTVLAVVGSRLLVAGIDV